MKYSIPSLFILIVAGTISCNSGNNGTTEKPQQATATASPDTSLKLPEGFSAAIFADNLGSARHIAFSNGDVFVRLGGMKNGHGILRLRDTNNDGVADSITG